MSFTCNTEIFLKKGLRLRGSSESFLQISLYHPLSLCRDATSPIQRWNRTDTSYVEVLLEAPGESPGCFPIILNIRKAHIADAVFFTQNLSPNSIALDAFQESGTSHTSSILVSIKLRCTYLVKYRVNLEDRVLYRGRTAASLWGWGARKSALSLGFRRLLHNDA